MRSAYDNYRDASEILDVVASQGPIDISSRDRTWGIESLAAKQRIEFETYIDKRLQYSEFVRDRSNLGGLHVNFQRTAGDSTASNQRRGRGLWLGNMTSRIAVGAALLCIMFFIVRDQMRIHDLDVARLETSATLNHTRDDYRSLSRKLSDRACRINWRLGRSSEQRPPLFPRSPILCMRTGEKSNCRTALESHHDGHIGFQTQPGGHCGCQEVREP